MQGGLLIKKKRFQYKNWIIIIDKSISGLLRARVSVINKKDFIFKLSRSVRKKSKRYPGTEKMLTGFAGFDDRFTLRANIEEIAQEFFMDKDFLTLLKGLPEFEFYIKDEDGCFPLYSLVFPEEADVLVLTAEGIMRKKELKAIFINIFEKALDKLVKMDVIDPDNEIIGKF